VEKRDAFLLLLALGGAGYAAYANWDVIAEKLSLAELSPSHLKAIQLAKDSSDLGAGATNWQWLQSRERLGEIRLAKEPWSSRHVAGQDYDLIVRWDEDGDAIAHRFRVDIANRTVAYEGQLPQAASPR
jgi:hypothetical protein